MNAIKIIIFFLLPISLIGQNEKYPKDTVYLKYSHDIKDNWNAKFSRDYRGKSGIYFNIKLEDGNVVLFYNKEESSDTLDITNLKCFPLVKSVKKITERHQRWLKKPYHEKSKPPIDKNGAFETFVIEELNNRKIVVYPVIWRNEEATP